MLSFGNYSEAWVMLLGFLEDLCNVIVIAKAVSTFGILVHQHDSNNLARVVAKVYLNDDGKVLNSMKVNAGLPTRVVSWMVLVFTLMKKCARDVK